MKNAYDDGQECHATKYPQALVAAFAKLGNGVSAYRLLKIFATIPISQRSWKLT